MNCFETFLALIVFLVLINILWNIGVAIFWIAIVVVILLILIHGFKYVALILAKMGVRNKFIFDSLIWMQTESFVLQENDFTFVDYIAPGKDCLGKLYYCTSKQIHAKVILHAPLTAPSFNTKVIFTNINGGKLAEIKYNSDIDPEKKRERIIKALMNL